MLPVLLPLVTGSLLLLTNRLA
ncbi:MAG: hypothetical protein QG550_1966, partial [Pseudomonadota bacterium]|nr:hypothetical protein [Pseudomonadota bacterium]